MLGGAAAPMNQRTLFGSLQLAADIRSDRDEVVAARAVVRAVDQSDRHQPGASAAAPGHPPAVHVQPRVRRQPADRDGHGEDSGAEAERARLHARGPGTHADADPGQREGSPGRPRGVDPEAGGEHPAVAVDDAVDGRVHAPGDAARLPEHQRGPDDVVERFHQAGRRRLLRPQHAQQPPAPGPGPQPAPPDQDGVHLRSGARGDVHVVGGHQLGGVSRGRSRAPASRAACSRRPTTRPATAIPTATRRRATG